MFKIIGADQKEYGPITADQIRLWIRENRANQQTQCRREDEMGWLPLGQRPEFAPEFAAPQHPAPLGGTLPPLVPLPLSAPDRRFSGAAPSPAVEIHMLDCLARGWRLVRMNHRLILSAIMVVTLIQVGTNYLPLIGWLVGMIIQGPLLGGLFLLYLRRIRDQDSRWEDVFSGFGPAFLQLMVTHVVSSLLVLLSAVLFVVGALLLVAGHNSLVASTFGGMICCVGLLPPVYLSVAWIFALPLVIDKHLDFTEAMTLSRKRVQDHWWAIFGLVMTVSLLAAAAVWFTETYRRSPGAEPAGMLANLPGALLLGFGIFFVVPVFVGALMYAYEDLFRGSPEP